MKKIIAALLMIMLVVVPVTVAANTASQPDTADIADVPDTAAVEFSPRLSAPDYSNKYYYSDKNVFYKWGYGMPNCTAYAWGRAYEILGTEPKLSIYDAQHWWPDNIEEGAYPYGSVPKLGAIACWKYPGGGHVAVVEQVDEDSFTLSHSAWGGPNFYTTEYDIDAENGGSSNSYWTFQGYIYILDNAFEGEPVDPPKGDLYKVNSDDGINLRSGAGTSYPTVDAIPDRTEIYVTEAVYADGYLWGKTSYGSSVGWCVLDFTVLVNDDPNYNTAPEKPDNTTPSNPDSEVEGDLDCDGRLTISDATVLQKHLAGFIVSLDLSSADVNSDGRITIADSTYIQKVIAGLI